MYILLLLYKLLRKKNVVTLKPRLCRQSKGTARKLVDIIPTIISLINILITQSYYKWKCFLITVTLTLAQWPWPDQPQMQSKARSSWQLSIDKVSSRLVEIHWSYWAETFFSFFSNSDIDLDPTNLKCDPKLGLHNSCLYTKFHQDWLKFTQVIERKHFFNF